MTIGPAAAIRAGWRATTPIAALILAAVAVGWHTVVLSAGFLLNNYPFLSPDSYDWILEGVYLTRMLTGAAPASPLPMGRSPVFVLLMMMDAALGQRGWVFAAVSATTLLATGWLLLPHWGRFRYATVVALSGLALVLVAPVNFLRFYVLSDTLCVALSIAAFLLVFRAADQQGKSWLGVTASIATALAGLTQGYGVVAPGVAAAVIGGRAVRHRQGAVARRVALIWLGALGAVVVGRKLWFSFLPHQRQPLQLERLALTTDMTHYYLETWAYLFLPLALPLLTIRIRQLRRVAHSPLTLAAWVTAGVFALLCLAYQWRSTRFTAFFWPFLVLATLRTTGVDVGPPRRGPALAVALAAAVAILQSVVVTPTSYINPALTRQTVAPQRSWLLEFVRSTPADRMDLAARCGSRAALCPAARRLSEGSPYQQELAEYYQRLMLDRDAATD
jgi:hypothetical protein